MSAHTIHGREVITDDSFDYLFEKKWSVSKLGYVSRGIYSPKTKKSKTVYLHRIIMNAGKGQEVDHINRNPSDNRISNLRFATRELQCLNRNSKGVYYDKSVNGYKAYFKRIYLGYFKNMDEAMAVQRAYKMKYIEDNF